VLLELDAGVQLGDAHDVMLHKTSMVERRRNGAHRTGSFTCVPSPGRLGRRSPYSVAVNAFVCEKRSMWWVSSPNSRPSACMRLK
jgi:hypothetical protein